MKRTALWELAGHARTLADKGGEPALRALAEEALRRLEDGDAIARTGGHLRGCVVDILTAFDGVYDELFPVRILVVSPVGSLSRDAAVRALDALHALGALDAAVVEHALRDDQYLGYAVLGRRPFGDHGAGAPATCAAVVQGVFDDLLWRLTAPDGPAQWRRLPEVLVPRGLRFVLRALAWPPDHPAAARLGGATLTPEERRTWWTISAASRKPSRSARSACACRPGTPRCCCRCSGWPAASLC